jgi:hypothetical protein
LRLPSLCPDFFLAHTNPQLPPPDCLTMVVTKTLEIALEHIYWDNWNLSESTVAKFFAVLSKPVLQCEGSIVVLLGTITGVKINMFSSMSEADDYFRLIRSAISMGPEFAPDVVIIDGESEYEVMKRKFDEEYERLCIESGSSTFFSKRLFAQIRSYLK